MLSKRNKPIAMDLSSSGILEIAFLVFSASRSVSLGIACPIMPTPLSPRLIPFGVPKNKRSAGEGGTSADMSTARSINSTPRL